MADHGIALLEKLSVLAIPRQDLPPLLQETFFQGEFDSRPLIESLRALGFGQGGSEAVVLCTCERLELYLHQDDDAERLAAIEAVFANMGLSATGQGRGSDWVRGEAALRHLFASCASLMSEVLGETNILGQIKAALGTSTDAGIAGPRLARLYQAAFAAAKKIRGESGIAEQPVSMAAVAMRLARQVQGDLTRCKVLLLGLGELAEFLAEEFLKAGVGQFTVVHPSVLRAESAAQALGALHRVMGDLPQLLADSDIVIAGLPKGEHGIDADSVERALQSRRRKPIFLLDVALPSGIDSPVADVDDAYLFDTGDLERMAMKGWKSREESRESAQRLLAREVAAFLAQEKSRQVVPLVTALRRHFEESRVRVLENHGEDAAKATDLLVKQLLHDPIAALRRAAGESEAVTDDVIALEDALRQLFPLDSAREDDDR
jgi:glutamyl-tRNA reductase